MDHEIKDNKIGKPLDYYRTEFAKQDPVLMSEKSGLRYDSRIKTFHTKFLGRDMAISFPDLAVSFQKSGEKADPITEMLFARLLMYGEIKLSGGTFMSFQEIPWGGVYLPAFRGRCIMRLAHSFGSKPDSFEKACTAFGGLPVKGADKGFEIEFIEGLFIRLFLWLGDEEFGPSAQFLFSDNFPKAFMAEDIAVIGDITINALKGVK